jgi:aspartyl-tRNA(Asn)/glutamyl-tRNA(Gln) amidotransferase subunit C
MKVNDELILKLARLSKLEVSNAELPRLRSDLEKMIVFVEKINELNLDQVEPLLHITEAKNVFREDEISGTLSREDALRNAPGQDGEFFRVPRVFKKTE